MKKFKYLFIYGLKKRMMTKAFFISNIILGLLIIAITLIPSFINMGQSTEVPDQQVELEGNIYYLNQIDDNIVKYKDLEEKVSEYAKNKALAKEYIWKIETTKYDKGEKDFYNDEKTLSSILLVFKEESGKLAVSYYNNNSDTRFDALVKEATKELNRIIFLEGNNIPQESIADTTVTQFDDENAIAKEVEKSIGTAVSSILIVPMFILVMMGVQFIGTDIIEEKSSKAIEVIIASVPPKTHFYSKIASTISFLTIQLLAYFSFAVIGLLINSLIGKTTGSGVSWQTIIGDKGQMLAATIIFTIIFALVGTLLYMIIGAFIASVAVNQEDYQQVQSPIMMILVIGYMASIVANSSGLPLFIKILSYIPFTAPLSAPGAYFAGTIGILDICISLVLLIATIILATYIIAPIYKASILSYDEGKLIKRIKKIIKNSRTMKKQQKN